MQKHWIERQNWSKPTVHPETIVEISGIYLGKDTKVGKVKDFDWGYNSGLDSEGNIHFYRVVEEFVEEVKSLTPNKKYEIKYTGQFCHSCDLYGHGRSKENETWEVIFVGTIDLEDSAEQYSRNIFYCPRKTQYFMFSADNLNYIVGEV